VILNQISSSISLRKKLMVHHRLSQLSARRQALVRQCQQIDFGKIVNFAVQDGDPVILAETEILIDVKLDADDSPRTERDLDDFELGAEVVRLLSKFDAIQNGMVDHLEVRAGIPRRVVLKCAANS
jgi:hypothetical protein